MQDDAELVKISPSDDVETFFSGVIDLMPSTNT
jgi:hypothetical protein